MAAVFADDDPRHGLGPEKFQAAGRNWSANLRSRAANFSRDVTIVFVRGNDPSSSRIDILASTCSFGITQSIGIA